MDTLCTAVSKKAGPEGCSRLRENPPGVSTDHDTLFIRSGKKPVQAFGEAEHPGTT